MSTLDFFNDLVIFTKSGKSLPTITPATNPSTDEIYDFITVLELAQGVQLDFLPITWQVGLGRIGQGATAAVQQALIHLQTSFAFKRVKRSPSSCNQYDSTRIYQVLLAEVAVLTMPSIRFHPNIVRLEGICWDIDPLLDDVWPVLVFEKTPHGDLETFMGEIAGKSVDIRGRLKYCVEIAIAIISLHSLGIVHGDIKPANILVYDDNSNGYTMKVSDFGYATLFGSNNTHQLFTMPGSPYWVAPEWHHQFATDVEGAKRMDAYSFGVVCLWLLFYNTGCEDNPDRYFYSDAASRKITSSFAQDSIMGSVHFNDQEKNDLAQFFRLTLASEPCDRNSDFGDLLRLLPLHPRPVIPTSYIPRSNEVELALRYSGVGDDFKVERSLCQFYLADYRLRAYIVQTLEKRARESYSPLIAKKAAFELALSYALGFGVTKDCCKSETYLKQAMRLHSDIESRLCLIRKSRYNPTFWRGDYSRLFAQGHNVRMDSSQRWIEQRVLDKAEINLKKEIADIVNVLGNDHDIVSHLRSDLLLALQAKGSWKEAELVGNDILKTAKKTHGENHRHTLASMGVLVTIYQFQRRWRKAQVLDKQVLQKAQELLSEDDPLITTSMTSLAATFSNQGKLRKSERLHIQTIEVMKRTLGEHSERTLTSIGNLACVYRDQGRLKDAEELETEVLRSMTRYLGPNHPSTLTCMRNLSATYFYQKRYQEAEQLSINAFKLTKALLGDDHEDTVASMEAVVSDYWAQGKWTEFKQMKTQIIAIRSQVREEQNPSVLTLWGLRFIQDVTMAWVTIHVLAAKIVRQCQGRGTSI